MIPDVFYPHAIVANGTALTQLQDVTPANNYTDIVEWANGQAAPSFSGSEIAIPDFQFSEHNLKAVLDLCPTEGVCGDLSAGNVDLYYRRGANRGTRYADNQATHERGRLTTNALLYWTGIKAAQNGDAQIMARFLPVWDLTTYPLVWLGGTTLNGLSAADYRYTLGPIYLNGAQVAGVQDSDWQNNIQPEEVAADGEEFISYGAVDQYAPTLTFRSRDTTLMRAFGAKGTALTSLYCYFRRRYKSGINYPDGSGVHIQFYATVGTIKAREIKGLKGVVEVFVQMTKPTSTTTPFAVSTVAAIS